MKKLLLTLQLLVLFPGLAMASENTDEGTANYVSYDSFLRSEHQGAYKYYQSNVRSLVNQFKLLCPDTICEGQYGTVVPVQFYCSIEKTSRKMGHCIWEFAAMEPSVNATDGTINSDARLFECKFSPIADEAQFRDFMRRASFRNGVGSTFGITRTGIPGMGKTLWDVVLECFHMYDDLG